MWGSGAWDDPTRTHWFPDEHIAGSPWCPSCQGAEALPGHAEPLPGLQCPPQLRPPQLSPWYVYRIGSCHRQAAPEWIGHGS